MRTITGIACAVCGALLGMAAVVGAQSAKGTNEPARLQALRIERAGDYSFRFIHDTKTNICYLAAVGGPSTVTAIVQTTATSCSN